MVDELVTPESERITHVHNQSVFCEMVRRSMLGNLRCAYCDIEKGMESFSKRSHLIYRCHTGLKDIVAPILIGDHHVANIYLGQIYAPLRKDIKDLYDELELADKGVKLDNLNQAYKELRQVSDKRMEIIGRFLFDFAKFLSLYATTRASVRVFSNIGYGLGSEDDIRLHSRTLLENAKRIINFTDGGIWIQDEHDPERLKLLVADWVISDDLLKEYVREGIPKGKGLVGGIFETGESLLKNTKAEIDEIPAYKTKGRESRNPKAFLGVPLKEADVVVGVLEVGNNRENAFWPDDVRILEEIARHVSLHITSVQQFSRFVADILHPNDSQSLMDRIVRIIPNMVEGIGCSIFLRDKPGSGSAYCVATSHGFVDVERGEESTAVYAPGEGLTGWVLGHGRILNLKVHQNTQDRNEGVKAVASRIFGTEGVIVTDPSWKSKYQEDVSGTLGKPISADDFARMPFLAVPIWDLDQKVIGVLRISGRLSGGNFSVEDEKLLAGVAELIASLVSDQQISPIKLLRLLKVSSEMQDETNFQRFAYILLTLLSHIQGLGINRVMLFEYDERFKQLRGRMAIGPGDTEEIREFRERFKEIAPLKDCIDNFEELIEVVKSSKLQSEVERFMNLDPPCRIFEAIESGSLSVRHLSLEKDEPLSGDFRDLFGRIGAKYPTLLVLPVPGEKVYVIMCDDAYRDAKLDDGTVRLLESLGLQVLRAFKHLHYAEHLAITKQAAWRDAAKMAAHNLGNKLPFAYDMIKEASQRPDPFHNKMFWDETLEILGEAQTVVNALRQLQQNINIDQLVSCRELLKKIKKHLAYLQSKAKSVVNPESCPDLRLRVDMNAFLECFDMLAQNAVESKRKDRDLEIRISYDGVASEEKEQYGLLPGGDFIVLQFVDNGKGVPNKLKKRIFEPYFTTRPKGAGIGLAFVQYVVTLHGGTIIENGEVEKGARFRLFLPIDKGRK